MRIVGIALLLGPLLATAQTQTKSQCQSTVRARSMSISSKDAEKICEQDSPDVMNCAITKMQGSRLNSGDAVKSCRTEWGFANEPEAKPSPSPSVSPSPNSTASPTIKVPVKELEKEEKSDSFEEI